MGAVVEFTAITSEGWFVVLIVDLLTSLTNPFKDYRANMRRYHAYVWTLGVAVFASVSRQSTTSPQSVHNDSGRQAGRHA